MEAQHTPGPWIAVKGDIFWHIKANFGKWQADVLDTDYYDEEAEANAKLCASAPDLLKENERLKEANRVLLAAVVRLNAALDAYWKEESCTNYRIVVERQIVVDNLINKNKGGE